MSVAPIMRSLTVKAPPQRAFELFTSSMGKWWPKGVAERPHVAIVLEPHAGGRWFERDDQGKETPWGDVISWEPPTRVLLAWRLNTRWTYDPNCTTEVEITFKPATGGGTTVTLEHRKLEQFGEDAARHSDSLRGGWPAILDQYAGFADAAKN